MLAKLLEDIAKRILATIEGRKYGTVFVGAAFTVCAAYLLLQYFNSTPSALPTLLNPIFLTIVALSLGVGAAVAMKQSAKVPRIAALSGLIAYSLAAGGAIWYLQHDRTPVFRIDVVFDDSVDVDATSLISFLRASDQPHIRIKLLQERLALSSGSPQIAPGAGQEGPIRLKERIANSDSALGVMFEDAELAARPKIRTLPTTTHTVLVTQRKLTRRPWSNLFYAIEGRFAVVSLYGIVQPTSAQTQSLQLRYLASMIPLAALHMDARLRGTTFLPERGSEIEQGCLHDFSMNRGLLIAKLVRGPELCAPEIAGLSQMFGPTLIAEYQTILAKAQAQRP